MLIQDILPPQQVVVIRELFLRSATKAAPLTTKKRSAREHKVKVH